MTGEPKGTSSIVGRRQDVAKRTELAHDPLPSLDDDAGTRAAGPNRIGEMARSGISRLHQPTADPDDGRGPRKRHSHMAGGLRCTGHCRGSDQNRDHGKQGRST
ncbi:MAG: hypothetical protein CMJ24_08795 [Phycisphaerae bacterium]|nr:hypothetical protein [Phycisphaerae bacterium]